MEINLPHNFNPRSYQLPLLRAMDSGCKRAVCVWHRRAGKDKTLINLIAKKMFERVGTYYYFFPTYQQGKKILWNGIDKDGFKMMDHIPHELRKRTDNNGMFIEAKNGSVFQVIGTDNVDSIVGTNAVGCVFSEYALQDPIAWGYIRPILAENGGWAVFNFTSRGRNHGYQLLKYAEQQQDWFTQILKADETGVFSSESLAKERDQYMIEDGDLLRYMQEYMCSFEGSIQGSYYGKFIQQAEEDGRITNVPYDALLPVDTWWDLGVGDSMSIWFTQTYNKEIRVIDYYENNGEGFNHYANVLNGKGYTYKGHFAPHDIKVKEMGTGLSRLETAASLGIRFEEIPKLSIDDGIQAVRSILSRCWFDAKKTERGLECLRNYHKKYNEKMKVYSSTPNHDWSSHAADAFRYMAVGYNTFRRSTSDQYERFEIEYDDLGSPVFKG